MRKLLKRLLRPARPTAVFQPGSADASHIHVDEGARTIYVDEARRAAPSVALFLTLHPKITGHVYEVVSEPFSDVARRNDEAKASQARDAAKASSPNNARSAAIALLKTAAQCRASDVHILKRTGHTEIQFRIKKSLRTYRELSGEEGSALLVALYRLGSSQDATFKENETQDGGITGQRLEGTGLENVRIVRGPAYPSTAGGQHMELRLQYREKASGSVQMADDVVLREPRAPSGALKLKEFGFDDKQIDRLLLLASVPAGLLLLTGPTGSGKTTTIFELAKWQARSDPDKRCISIEQPVEYPMPWAIQLEISNTLSKEQAGKKFAEYLRYTLRMDPDRLIVGEIRDAEVALTAFDAAQTGHSELSTLHVDDPFDFPLRFQNMDFDRLSYRVTCNSSVIRGVVAQRLLPLLCQECCLPWSIDDDRIPQELCQALASWGDTSAIRRTNPEGCAHCGQTGTMSVTCVAEVVITDEELMNDFINPAVGITGARRRYRSRPNADTPMIERAIALALAGRVDPKIIVKDVGAFPFKDQVDLDRKRGRLERDQEAQRAQAIFELAPR